MALCMAVLAQVLAHLSIMSHLHSGMPVLLRLPPCSNEHAKLRHADVSGGFVANSRKERTELEVAGWQSELQAI